MDVNCTCKLRRITGRKFPTALTSSSLHQTGDSERHIVFEVISPSQQTKTDTQIQNKNARFYSCYSSFNHTKYAAKKMTEGSHACLGRKLGADHVC